MLQTKRKRKNSSSLVSHYPFLNVSPTELKFPFKLRQQSSCSIHLTNKTDQYVAFKIKATSPYLYCVRPNVGVVSPRAICGVEVTMRAPKEAPSDMQCKDKFLVQSFVVVGVTTNQDITSEMFDERRRIVGEFKLKVIHISVNPSSPIPEATSISSFDPMKTNVSVPTRPAKVQLPKTSVFCLKNKKLVKEIEKVEDCFILEFDPYESFDLSSLSKCLDQLKDAPNIAVIAEKGQVACRDYPHPRHLCATHPFKKTPHEIHCKMCYCYVCDKPAPAKIGPKMLAVFLK